MRLQALGGVGNYRRANNASALKQKSVQSSGKVFDINDFRPNNFSRALTFTSRPDKECRQLVSIAPEYQGILNKVYKAGGLGNVAGEAAVAFQEHTNMDVRTIVPYYSAGNKAIDGEEVGDGFVQVMRPKEGKDWRSGLKLTTDNYEFDKVPISYELKDGEQFVVHQEIIGNELKGQYIPLLKTKVTGIIQRIKDDLSGTSDIKYSLFQVMEDDQFEGLAPNPIAKSKKPIVYLLHTPELSQFDAAYAYKVKGGKGVFADRSYGEFSRAAVDVLPKLNDESFGNFNPANIWLHDRQAFPVMMESASQSATNDYFRGLRTHATYHNPTRAYQGAYMNPIDFLKIVGTPDDLEQLKKNPEDFQFIQDMIKKINTQAAKGKIKLEDAITKDELKRLQTIFDPLYGNFVDGVGDYNMCAIPITAVRKNPFNCSMGTVSNYFGKEMSNHNTPEIAEGLTKLFDGTPMINIVNGSSASSLELDNQYGKFGFGIDFPREVKENYTPLTEDVLKDADKLFSAKQKNKPWLIDAISEAIQKGKDGLEQLFDRKDIEAAGDDIILGNFSKYKDGDVFIINWGRPDPQKGFTTSLNGLLSFFKDPSVKEEYKGRVKYLCVGGPWGDCKEWSDIKDVMKQIQEYDGGKYKDNVLYINAKFSNRMVACADFAQITSRFEPCGITPLESFSAGTPVLSHRTGGSPDFCQELKTNAGEVGLANSLLTDHAFMTRPEVLGLDPALKGVELDEARVKALGLEDGGLIKRAVELFVEEPDKYKQMSSNAAKVKVGWHENNAFNGGVSAIDRYKQEVFQIGKDNQSLVGQERCMEPLQSLKGQIAQKTYQENVQQAAAAISQGPIEAAQQVKNAASKIKFTGKTGLIIGAAVAAAIGLGVRIFKSAKNKETSIDNKNQAENQPEIQNATQNTKEIQNSSIQTPEPIKVQDSIKTEPKTNPIQLQTPQTMLKSPMMENFLKNAG